MGGSLDEIGTWPPPRSVRDKACAAICLRLGSVLEGGREED